MPNFGWFGGSPWLYAAKVPWQNSNGTRKRNCEIATSLASWWEAPNAMARLWKQGKPGPQQHLVSDVSAIIFQYISISMNHYEPLSMCHQRKAGQRWSHAWTAWFPSLPRMPAMLSKYFKMPVILVDYDDYDGAKLPSTSINWHDRHILSPMPTCAPCIMGTSLAPSPMAKVMPLLRRNGNKQYHENCILLADNMYDMCFRSRHKQGTSTDPVWLVVMFYQYGKCTYNASHPPWKLGAFSTQKGSWANYWQHQEFQMKLYTLAGSSNWTLELLEADLKVAKSALIGYTLCLPKSLWPVTPRWFRSPNFGSRWWH